MEILPTLLGSLSQSINSALEVPSKLAALAPIEDGVSLLDVKNELLLSYLQNLVFLIILKLRAARKPAGSTEDGGELRDSVTRKLVELRLYLEKGARPLEDKMRFQIERLVRAADEAEGRAAAEAKKNGIASQEEGSDAESGSEDGDAAEEDDAAQEAGAGAAAAAAAATARPRLFNLIAQRKNATSSSASREVADSEPNDAIYRPPRRERQLMEEDAAAKARKREKTARRPNKSAAIDEFIAGEMSWVPVEEPSVGTNVEGRGRRVKTAAERAVETERRDYEESNFVRLPKESKKEKAKKQGRRTAFGGEDFHDISGQVDRIDRLTRPKDGPRAGTVKALLEKSRKRGRESTGGAEHVGERFQKKLKVMESGRRDRGHGRR